MGTIDAWDWNGVTGFRRCRDIYCVRYWGFDDAEGLEAVFLDLARLSD